MKTKYENLRVNCGDLAAKLMLILGWQSGNIHSGY
jgi:hypothetical protein